MNKSLFFISFIFLIATTTLAQSPWVLKKSGIYTQFTFNTIPEYHTLFNGKGVTFETSRLVKDRTLQIYTEYGLTDKFTMIASVPYKLIELTTLNPSYNGPTENIPEATKVNAPGNIQLSLKYKILQQKWVSALQIRLETPASPKTGISTGFDAFSIFPIISVGRGWNKFYTFYWLSAIIRGNNYSEYLNSGIEAGVRANRNIWIIAYSELMHSFNNGTRPATPFGIKTVFEKSLKNENKIGLIANLAGSFSGRFVAHAPFLSIGVFLKH
ncbi:MAG: hypothetical protein CVT92_16955 [Bacteroidetes bacterium HGW-Bacteroidetes-1]|nr:MAG: hypothetical protein CVT92_16955 [Bacteroidetes bacterium HGW-Bacteroidetes-1]